MKAANAGRTSLTLGADDFLPLFVWVLVKTNFIAAEIEAEYMWGKNIIFEKSTLLYYFIVLLIKQLFTGLLHPSLLSGEGGYYLTTLSSAVHVLKNFKETGENPLSSPVNSEVNCYIFISNNLKSKCK